ncbi:lasso peptide isopeptide bond-forming cyclase [Streptacidiphilus jiangxiensis]|uniref:asparagine synthase (glutamine-hydrolyzing) n=1 Tax=Streptacidiphilus jiangxiensis TaxID=235985 RepID=A0A1H8A4E8_STRJI|nr:lasso peptide isopeptide bond-forming cyclase [Streptacidiphilus jiangxiensis]SEM64708.1 asparagine synthase (glutamine-hydrolysing) [Streptacidiphilus jiangxiensis]
MSSGFLVLPDRPSAEPLSTRPAQPDRRVIRHASGRPWLVGRWPAGEVAVAEAGPVRLVAVGPAPVGRVRLSELAARINGPADAARVLQALRGSCHLGVSLPDWSRFRGSSSGLRRLFRTRVGGVTVAADRADLLAALTDADLDEEALALRVACGLQLPYPANARSPWSGVTALAPDHALEWDADTAAEIRWWEPPEPELSLRAGADVVRTALLEATRGKRPESGRISADLSGGLDSGSICFLAARQDPELLAFRWGEAEAGNDDTVFAELAMKELDRADHLVVPQSELPEMFADAATPVGGEMPSPLTRATARIRHSALLLSEHGSVRHLSGHGGDELFSPLPGYLHPLLRRRPVTALRHLRAHVALRRWPARATLAELLRPTSFTRWWDSEADALTEPRPPQRRAALGWGLGPIRAPGWVTPDAAEAARAGLRHAARDATPLARDLGTHQTLLVIRSNTLTYRLLGDLYAARGIVLDAPYLDDRVIDAVLRVRPEEHAGPWHFKPLLAEAMRGLVPERLRARSTKGEFGEDVRRGLRAHLPALLDLLGPDSRLAARGLIDPQALRARMTGPQADNSAVQALENLVGCETWLRSLPVHRS